MTTVLLSQHSSNPLERGSSDTHPPKSIFRKRLRVTKDSSDPISGFDVGSKRQRHQDSISQSASVRSVAGNTRAALAGRYNLKGKGRVVGRNFLRAGGAGNEDMGSDELIIVGEDKKEMKGDVVIEEDEEDVAEAEEQEHQEDSEPSDNEEDDEDTLSSKPVEEQQEIIAEIQDLETAVPALTTDYKLLDRLGTGTFSSVYKAIDLHYHDKWYNDPWHGHHPPSSSAYYQSIPRPQGAKVYVAIKRIYVTSSPERIRNEISILSECRSCRHVSQLITAFRKDDQVVVVMPYQKNDDFRDYFTSLPMEGIKAYMRCLIRALRDIHARKIIHRDVKPANFLFDPRTGIGTLCDFGLACRMEPGPQHDQCLHTPPTREYPHGRIKDRKDYDVEYFRRMSKEAKFKSSQPSEKVGYPEKDTRPQSKANRAGTRGFRAPEVLLKCGDQTGAIDMWAAGMTLLFFLTKKFPLFQSNDDIEALMEIATILGRRRMERVACLHNRMFSTNVPDISPDGMSWRDFVLNQNPDLYTPPKPDARFYPYSEQLARAQQQTLQQVEAQEEDQHPDDNNRNPLTFEEYSNRETLLDSAIPHRDRDQATPIPSSSPSHLNIDTTNLLGPSDTVSSATSITFPSSSPLNPNSKGSVVEEELSPLTPLSGASGADFGFGAAGGGGDILLVGPSREAHERDVENALNLLEKLMEHQSTDRITPRKALYHPFLYNGAQRDGVLERRVSLGKASGSKAGPSDSSRSSSERMTRLRSRAGTSSNASSSSSALRLDFGTTDQDEDMEPATHEDKTMVEIEDEDDADDLDPEDDEFFPHPFGEGVCRKWHFLDEVTEEHCIHIYADEASANEVRRKERYVDLDSGDESLDGEEGLGVGEGGAGQRKRKRKNQHLVVRRLVNGEGIAIGRQPCEFHKVGYELDMSAAVPL